MAWRFAALPCLAILGPTFAVARVSPALAVVSAADAIEAEFEQALLQGKAPAKSHAAGEAKIVKQTKKEPASKNGAEGHLRKVAVVKQQANALAVKTKLRKGWHENVTSKDPIAAARVLEADIEQALFRDEAKHKQDTKAKAAKSTEDKIKTAVNLEGEIEDALRRAKATHKKRSSNAAQSIVHKLLKSNVAQSVVKNLLDRRKEADRMWKAARAQRHTSATVATSDFKLDTEIHKKLLEDQKMLSKLVDRESVESLWNAAKTHNSSSGKDVVTSAAALEAAIEKKLLQDQALVLKHDRDKNVVSSNGKAAAKSADAMEGDVEKVLLRDQDAVNANAVLEAEIEKALLDNQAAQKPAPVQSRSYVSMSNHVTAVGLSRSTKRWKGNLAGQRHTASRKLRSSKTEPKAEIKTPLVTSVEAEIDDIEEHVVHVDSAVDKILNETHRLLALS